MSNKIVLSIKLYIMQNQTDKIGLLKVDVHPVEKDEKLANKIIQARGLSREDLPKILDMLKYNVFTIQQFSELSGKVISAIQFNMAPSYRGDVLDTALDYCYPFESLDKKGPKFIVRNEKSINYLLLSV